MSRYFIPLNTEGYFSPAKSEKRSNNKKLISLVVIIAAVIILLIFFLAREKTPEKLMDLRIKDMQGSVVKGGYLNYNVEALNLGNAEIYDITLRYDILNAEGKYFSSLRKQETLALKDKSVFPKEIRLNLPAGDYSVRVTATYGSERAEATEAFTITDENQTAQPEEQAEEIAGQIAEEESAQMQQAPEELPPVKKVTGLSNEELENRALEKCANDVQNAISLCSSISSSYNADFCLNECAEKSSSFYFCQRIHDADKKDNCYMTVALKGKPQACNSITNGYKKNSCMAMA